MPKCQYTSRKLSAVLYITVYKLYESWEIAIVIPEHYYYFLSLSLECIFRLNTNWNYSRNPPYSVMIRTKLTKYTILPTSNIITIRYWPGRGHGYWRFLYAVRRTNRVKPLFGENRFNSEVANIGERIKRHVEIMARSNYYDVCACTMRE